MGKAEAREFINLQIGSKKVVVFSKSSCPFCTKAKNALKAAKVDDYLCIEMEKRSDMSDLQDVLKEMTGARSVPRVFINGKCIGGGDETAQLQASGKLKALIDG